MCLSSLRSSTRLEMPVYTTRGFQFLSKNRECLDTYTAQLIDISLKKLLANRGKYIN